jgi:hypothetical protein
VTTANEGKAKGRKPTGGKPKGGTAKVDKKNYEEGKEMEGGVEGIELKSGALHRPRGGPTSVSVHWEGRWWSHLYLSTLRMETKTRFSKEDSNTRKEQQWQEEMDKMDQQCIGG